MRVGGMEMVIRCKDDHRNAILIQRGSIPMTHKPSPLLSMPYGPSGRNALGYKAVLEGSRGL